MTKPVFIWNERVLRSVQPENIVCLSTEKNYTRIFFVDNSYYEVRSSLSNAMKKLPAEFFIQVNRSIVASIFHIDKIARDHLILNGQIIPIPKAFYKPLVEKLDIIE